MELTFLHVAEYANSTEDKKLNVMGIFNNINATNFPAAHPEMYLVAQLSARASEYGRKFKLGIKLLNEDASKVIIDFQGDAEVPTGRNGLPVNMNIMLRLVNTVFPEPGTYGFSVLVDGDEKGTLPIEVIQLPPQA
jgi:hypothetical protein